MWEKYVGVKKPVLTEYFQYVMYLNINPSTASFVRGDVLLAFTLPEIILIV